MSFSLILKKDGIARLALKDYKHMTDEYDESDIEIIWITEDGEPALLIRPKAGAKKTRRGDSYRNRGDQSLQE